MRVKHSPEIYKCRGWIQEAQIKKVIKKEGVGGGEERGKICPLKLHKNLRESSLKLLFSFTEIEDSKICWWRAQSEPHTYSSEKELKSIQLQEVSCRPTASFLATWPHDKTKQKVILKYFF